MIFVNKFVYYVLSSLCYIRTYFRTISAHSMFMFCKKKNFSQRLTCIFNSPKKWTKNQIYSYGTSSQIIFVRFLGELKTPARHFEINWSLGHMRVHQFGSSWIDAFDNPSSLIMGYFTYKVLLFLRLGQKSLKNLLKTSKCPFEITWPL